MEKKISVIIPCYNVEKYINRCVASLVRQTIGVENLELIFVDDASTDGTLEQLYQWEAKYPESVMVVVCEENGRQGRARNIGLGYASADYISYVDADDWIEPEMLQMLYQAAMEQDVPVTACRMGRDLGDGKIVKSYDLCHNKDELICITSLQERHDFLELSIGPVVAKLYLKSFLLDNHLFFPEQTAYEDNYVIGLLAFCLPSIYVIDQEYYHYFANSASTVTSKNAMHHFERLYIEIALVEELKCRGLFGEFREEILGDFLCRYYINTLHMVFTRFETLPYEVLNEMRREVLLRFPDYKETKVYQELPEMSKGFCLTLETEMTQEKWDNLAKNYIFLLKNK